MKKMAAVMLWAVLVFALALPACADNYLYSTYTVNSVLECIGNALPLGAQISVTANGSEVDGVEVTTVAAEDRPVTYICLVDCSYGLSNTQRQQQMDILETVSMNLRPIDEMYLFYMANSIEYGECLTTAEERDAAIHEPFCTAFSTGLYGDIASALDTVRDEERFPNLKCMIVMSDGLDDHNASSNTSKIQAMLAEQEICLNAVALMDAYSEPYVVTRGRALTNLAALSHGGVGYVMNSDGVTATDAAVEFVENMMKSAIIRLDPNHLDRSSEELEITVSYEADEKSDTGTITVPVSELPAVIVPETEPETIPETAPQTEPYTAPMAAAEPTYRPAETEPRPAPQRAASKSKLGLYAACAAGAAAVLAVILFVVFRRRREEEEEEFVDPDLEFMELPDNFLADLRSEKSAAFNNGLLSDTGAPLQFNDGPMLIPGFHLELVRVDTGEAALKFYMPADKGITVGRNQRAEHVLNAADSGLSGCHFEVKWDGRQLFLRDRNSTNGTSLNGKRLPPEQWIPLDDEGILTVGSFEYRIDGEKERLL